MTNSSVVGILGYGSLIADPGVEIEPIILDRIDTVTPFAVEFARFSKSRGGGPTIVPYDEGQGVSAQILVLKDRVGVDEARDLLWRRETRKENSRKQYVGGDTADSVLVKSLEEFCGITQVLYTDFNQSGKIANPTPEMLASAAIKSVDRAEAGRDGVTYLKQVTLVGVKTVLTERYIQQVLYQTGAKNLDEVLELLRGRGRGRRLPIISK